MDPTPETSLTDQVRELQKQVRDLRTAVTVIAVLLIGMGLSVVIREVYEERDERPAIETSAPAPRSTP